jgi:deoxycytidylate deaminase
MAKKVKKKVKKVKRKTKKAKKKVSVNRRRVRTQKFSYGETIILGFTGSLGSGCTFIAKGIKKSLGQSCHHYELSKIITDKLKKQGIDKPTTKQKQNMGNKLRKEQGVSVLVDLCLKKIRRVEKRFNEDTVILVDGIRNDGEIRCLRVLPNFYLMSIHAEETTRIERLVGDKAPRKLFDTVEQFKEADKRDQEEEISHGQQVKECNYLADIIINNNDKLVHNTETENQYFSKIIQNYIPTMRAIRKGSQLPDHPPSINESLMTMAYCLSKRSSCKKRKVGAIIANVTEYENLKESVKRKDDHIKFQVISSGYNEVPLGTIPCTLEWYEGCYREHIKEGLAKQIICCPNCGRKIPKTVQSNLKRFEDYKCRCKTEILNAYLVGTAENSGKLLDICRALHGEENAIIGMAGVSKPHKGKLVLYTTTFPCNLCANKIVAAGIELVIYAEPYTIEESKSILANGKVDDIKFEGVKSTAYFRLYS